MTEIKFCVSRGDFAQQFTALPECEAWGQLQPGNGRVAAESPLARIHRHGGSADHERSFALTAPAEPAHTLCTVIPQAGAPHPQTVYAVHDGSGRFIGRIIQERSTLGMRQAWRVEDAGKQCSAVAYKGSIRAWTAYWVASPFLLVFALLGFLHDGEASFSWLWGKPRRTRWRMRAGGGRRKVALDFRSGRYRADTGVLDTRLLYAQAALYGA
ncbi:hypothetical protein AB0D04_10340 [Streptomyces sp. NPDC048483]|uniref:hypothetical protein n=1 Tax=Streptomyces sp. NPDC048483 TaxID=3154927 RepID=UPI003436112E